MSMKNYYKLLTSDNPEKLSKLVEEKLQEGYILYGDPSTSVACSGNSAFIRVFVQAVVKTVDESNDAVNSLRLPNSVL